MTISVQVESYGGLRGSFSGPFSAGVCVCVCVRVSFLIHDPLSLWIYTSVSVGNGSVTGKKSGALCERCMILTATQEVFVRLRRHL